MLKDILGFDPLAPASPYLNGISPAWIEREAMRQLEVANRFSPHSPRIDELALSRAQVRAQEEHMRKISALNAFTQANRLSALHQRGCEDMYKRFLERSKQASDNYVKVHGRSPDPAMNVNALIEHYGRIPTAEELSDRLTRLCTRIEAFKADRCQH